MPIEYKQIATKIDNALKAIDVETKETIVKHADIRPLRKTVNLHYY